MSNITSKLSYVFDLIKKGEIKSLINTVGSKLYSSRTYYGLKMDLTKELKKPRALVDISIRMLQDSDSPYFKDDNENTNSIKQLEKCYVAVTKEGIPCFRQWVMNASQNKKIHDFWGDTYPELKEDEALMESAFTTPKLRGMGIMPLAVHKIAEQCKNEGIKSIITFTPETNINSLRALNYAGFRPYCLTKETFFLFNKKVLHNDLTENMLEEYNNKTSPRRARKIK